MWADRINRSSLLHDNTAEQRKYTESPIIGIATAAKILDWHTRLGLLEKAHERFVGKSALLHVRLAPI